MPSVHSTLRLIDDRIRYLVHGYVRQREKKLIDCNVPVAITNICVLHYFVERDYWDKECIGWGLKLDEYDCLMNY